MTVRQFAQIMLKATGSPLEAQIPGEFRLGDTRHTDATWLAQHPELAEHYQRWAGELPANKP